MSKFRLSQSDARRKWIDALRSWKYKQTKKALFDKDAYCCLGVACELFVENEGIGEIVRGEFSGHIKIGDSCHCFQLPDAVRDWLGLLTNVGSENGKNGCLAQANDSGYTFVEIARMLKSGRYYIEAKEVAGAK